MTTSPKLLIGLGILLFAHITSSAYGDDPKLVASNSYLYFFVSGQKNLIKREVTIQNNDSIPAQISLYGTNYSDDFHIDGPTMGAFLYPGGSAKFTVSLVSSKPELSINDGLLLLTVSRTVNHVTKYVVESPVNLIAYQGSNPVSAMPTSLHFDGVKLGELSASQTLTLTNFTPFDLQLWFDPNQHQGFDLDIGQDPRLLANSTATFSLHLQPNTESDRTGNLIIRSYDSAIDVVSMVPVSGLSKLPVTMPAPSEPMDQEPVQTPNGTGGCQLQSLEGQPKSAFAFLGFAPLLGLGFFILLARYRRNRIC